MLVYIGKDTKRRSIDRGYKRSPGGGKCVFRLGFLGCWLCVLPPPVVQMFLFHNKC